VKRSNIFQIITVVAFVVSACNSPQKFATTGVMPTSTATIAEDHFHPKGKQPSEYTLQIFEEARAILPFSDRQDFVELTCLH